MDLFDKAFENLGISEENVSDTKAKINAEAGITELYSVDKDKEQHKIFYGLSEEDRFIAVQKHLVPSSYKYASFDSEKIKDNARIMYKKFKYITYRFTEYEKTCNGILSAIRMKKLPNRSYIIGAPNGYGKASFANECIITLNRNGFRATPFISLIELAYIRNDFEYSMLHKKMDPIYKTIVLKDGKYYEQLKDKDDNTVIGAEYVKKPDKIEQIYTFMDYLCTDCLFCYFTDDIHREIESYTLSQILRIRGAKGLPTIVMISTAIEAYTKQPDLKKYVWDEILAYSEKENCYDRVYHVSCYKEPDRGKLAEKGKNIDSETGIIK